MIRKDKNGATLKDGDIIDIHQTVNGYNQFLVVTVEPLEIVYYFNRDYKYQYNKEELLAPCRFTGEVAWEIIGNDND